MLRTWLGVLGLVIVAQVLGGRHHAAGQAPERHANPVEEKTVPPELHEADLAGGADELFRQAAELVEKEQFLAAIPLLRKAAALAPNEGRTHHYLGYALMQSHQAIAAKAEFERALALEPDNNYTRYFLARIAHSEGQVDRALQLYEAIGASRIPIYDTHQRLGAAYLHFGKLTQALAMTQKALEETPWDRAAHYQLGKIYQRMGRPQDAKREFETSDRLARSDQGLIQKLLELSVAIRAEQTENILRLRQEILTHGDKDPEILTRLGTLLGQGGFYAEAIQPLQTAVELDAASFEANYNLGLTWHKLKRSKEAEASLSKALALNPRSFEANSALAVLYVNDGQNRGALERLRAARQLRPRSVQILALLGQQYLQGRYLDEAIQTLREAILLKPQDPMLRFLLIQAYHDDRQYKAALSVAREALRLFPLEARGQLEVGQQLAGLGRDQEARPYLERAVKMSPPLAEASTALGNLQLRQGEYQSALASFEKARALGSDNVEVLRGTGKALSRLGRYPEAVSELLKSIQTRPDDAELHYQLLQAYSRLGEREKAAETERTFKQLQAKENAKESAERKRSFDPNLNNRASQQE